MPSPQRQPHRDRYGHPWSTLAPATAAFDTRPEQVLALQRAVGRLLDTEYADLFRRGVYATVQLTLLVGPGESRSGIEVHVTRHYRVKER
jgi:hypothetical protein